MRGKRMTRLRPAIRMHHAGAEKKRTDDHSKDRNVDQSSSSESALDADRSVPWRGGRLREKTRKEEYLVRMNSDSDEELEYECEAFEVLGQTISAMTVGELPLHVLANLSNRDAEISGQRVWAGSLLLAHYLGRGQGETLLGAGRALELGCGTGVLGIALKKALGEKLDVDLTDGDPKAIELLHENAVLNGLADDAGIFELFWGNEESMGAFREQRPDKYPVIMAGDVLYKKLLIQPLLQTVEKLLAPDGIFYLCHIPRFDVFHDVVAMAFSAGGWNVTNVIAPASILEKYPAPETWDSETLGDLRRAQIYEVRAPER